MHSMHTSGAAPPSVESPLAKLEFGVASSDAARANNQAQSESLLEGILMAPCDTGAERAYGPLRAAYCARNKQALNKLIASHALSLEVALVTNNEADFRGFPGLVVENWINAHWTRKTALI